MKFKNLVGVPIKILFDSNVIIYLKTDEISIDFPFRIVGVEKYTLFSTLKGDIIRWIPIDFEVDRRHCIRERTSRLSETFRSL
jgi:hypothetical protein